MSDSTFVRMKQDWYIGGHRPSSDITTEGTSWRDGLTGTKCNEVKDGLEVVGLPDGRFALIRWVVIKEWCRERHYTHGKQGRAKVDAVPEGWVIGMYATEGLADQAAGEYTEPIVKERFDQLHEVNHSRKGKEPAWFLARQRKAKTT